MSAPRKIWVPVPVTDEGPCYVDKDEAEMQWGCAAVAYHHDDVVRELVEALERARAFIHGPGDRCGPVLRHIDAALAKIAQEGEASLCQFCHDAGALSCACFDEAEIGDRP